MEIRLSQFVKAPVDKVFEVFSDISQAEARVEGITRIEMLSDVTRGVGTRWRETRSMFGREATEEMEITALVPNQSYEVVSESRGANYHTIYTFQPKADGTQVDLVFSATPITWPAKLMMPLGYLFQGTARKLLQADMDDLKQFCEMQV